jgi:hypothetical protein
LIKPLVGNGWRVGAVGGWEGCPGALVTPEQMLDARAHVSTLNQILDEAKKRNSEVALHSGRSRKSLTLNDKINTLTCPELAVLLSCNLYVMYDEHRGGLSLRMAAENVATH